LAELDCAAAAIAAARRRAAQRAKAALRIVGTNLFHLFPNHARMPTLSLTVGDRWAQIFAAAFFALVSRLGLADLPPIVTPIKYHPYQGVRSW
jgi:hypothetical protein